MEAKAKFKRGDYVKVIGNFGKGVVAGVRKGYNHYFYDVEAFNGGKMIVAVSERALTKISKLKNTSKGRKIGKYISAKVQMTKRR